MRRLLLIANPTASQFTGGMHRDVTTVLRKAYDIEPAWPGSPDEATELTMQAVTDGVDVVVAMGGDGVVHRVVNGLAESETALGIIPVGTTNVLAEILGVPSKPKDASKFLATSPTGRACPLARITVDDRSIHWATFAVGAGFDAEVVRQAERQPHRKYHFGGVHYARSAASVLWSSFRGRYPTMRVETNAEPFDAVSVLVQIHWPYTFFGRMPLTLAEEPPIHGVHVAGFERLALHAAPTIAARAMRGRLHRAAGAHLVEDTPYVVVEAEPPTYLQADGELLGLAGRIRIEAVPAGVTVLAPGGEVRRRRIRRRRRLQSET